MSAWWNSHLLETQVFYVVAFVSSAILQIQLLLSAIGADATDGIDDIPDGHGSGLGVFSVRTVAAFFAGFGWVGVICLKENLGLGIAVLAGGFAGGVSMVSTLVLMRALFRMQQSGTLVYDSALGSVGTVYIPIPAGGAPGGQVEVLINGRTVFAEARNDSSQVLKTGTKVRLTSLIDRTTFKVEVA
jgi:hypothetical protein